MTTSIILDSGIYLALVLPNEKMATQAQSLFHAVDAKKFVLCAPTLLRYELVSALRKNVFRGRIASEDAQRMLQKILSHRIKFYISERLVQRAYEFAEAHNLPTAYDAQYLAVAEHLNCEFWTADEKLVNSVSAALPWVKWIGGGLPS